ncbi:MAG: Tim44/TimA family putative adaptor protein [Devosia sp.]|nr:Tim44/TimA family putative adaptor protein [Devosia sp.]
MDEFFDIPTLIVIGVAIVVLFRLRQVLGSRMGHERPPVDPAQSRPDAKPAENVLTLRPRPADPKAGDEELRLRKLQAEVEQFAHGDTAVAEGFNAIMGADPTFTPKSFLEGAKQAYEMVLTAFAAGDRKTLRNLLEKDVSDGFERAMADREARGEKVDFTFVGLPKVEISHAALDKRSALITVQFHAEVVSATRSKDGTLIDGNAEQVKGIADEWTFARSPKSRDPNWKLIATNQLE